METTKTIKEVIVKCDERLGHIKDPKLKELIKFRDSIPWRTEGIDIELYNELRARMKKTTGNYN